MNQSTEQPTEPLASHMFMRKLPVNIRTQIDLRSPNPDTRSVGAYLKKDY